MGLDAAYAAVAAFAQQQQPPWMAWAAVGGFVTISAVIAAIFPPPPTPDSPASTMNTPKGVSAFCSANPAAAAETISNTIMTSAQSSQLGSPRAT